MEYRTGKQVAAHAATTRHQRTHITCNQEGRPSCLQQWAGSLGAQPLSQSLEVCSVIMATASCQGAPNQRLQPQCKGPWSCLISQVLSCSTFLLQQSMDHTTLLRPAKPTSSAAAAACTPNPCPAASIGMLQQCASLCTCLPRVGCTTRYEVTNPLLHVERACTY